MVMNGCNDSRGIMKRFIFGLFGFVVVWIVGLAPQFLAYAHVSGIIIFALEGGLSMAGYLLYVRVVEKRHAVELSRFRIALLPLGILIGLIWFGLLIAMLYASGHYSNSEIQFFLSMTSDGKRWQKSSDVSDEPIWTLGGSSLENCKADAAYYPKLPGTTIPGFGIYTIARAKKVMKIP
jgi:hypothetical protein